VSQTVGLGQVLPYPQVSAVGDNPRQAETAACPNRRLTAGSAVSAGQSRGRDSPARRTSAVSGEYAAKFQAPGHPSAAAMIISVVS
jgi:hypothetical protein